MWRFLRKVTRFGEAVYFSRSGKQGSDGDGDSIMFKIPISQPYWLIDVLPKQVPAGPVFYAKTITALVVFGVLLGLLVRYASGCTTFWGGFLIWGVVTRVIKKCGEKVTSSCKISLLRRFNRKYFAL